MSQDLAAPEAKTTKTIAFQDASMDIWDKK